MNIAAQAKEDQSTVETGETLLGERVVLIPVKAFDQAKHRLGNALSPRERRVLVQDMAEHVVHAAAPLPVAVVCDDSEVAQWARNLNALVIWEPGRGLNGAVQEGVERLGSMGVLEVTVAHGDLPFASGLCELGGFEGVTLVPDRRRDGTNVIVVPTGRGFRFSYGPGSFERHRAECERLGLAARVIEEPGLAFDVDFPGDLDWTKRQAP